MCYVQRVELKHCFWGIVLLKSYLLLLLLLLLLLYISYLSHHSNVVYKKNITRPFLSRKTNQKVSKPSSDYVKQLVMLKVLLLFGALRRIIDIFENDCTRQAVRVTSLCE